MATKRENFTDRDKAKLYEQGKAICAFCGTDLWHFRQAINPHAEHDWADHVRPSSRGGGRLLENGVTACSGCNVKKGDNTRDRDYLFSNGRPTEEYLLRFDYLNPVVQATIRANAQVHWTDWYFNRAVCHLSTAVSEEWRLIRGLDPAKRTPAYWAGAAMKRAREWRRYREKGGVVHPFERGLAPVEFEADHALILGLFDCETVEQAVEIAKQLVPLAVGHRLFYLIKFFGLHEGQLFDLIRRDFSRSSASEAVAAFLTNPEVIEAMADDLDEWGIANLEGGRLVPAFLPSWPALPVQRVSVLLEQLEATPAARTKVGGWGGTSR